MTLRYLNTGMYIPSVWSLELVSSLVASALHHNKNPLWFISHNFWLPLMFPISNENTWYFDMFAVFIMTFECFFLFDFQFSQAARFSFIFSIN